MSEYMLEVDHGWDEDGNAIMWDVRLGFSLFDGYYMTIEDCDFPTENLENYIFHNMRDVPEIRMTLPEVEEALAGFGIGIPERVAAELAAEGMYNSYVHHLKKTSRRKYAETVWFCRRALTGRWEPMGRLPLSWECLTRAEGVNPERAEEALGREHRKMAALDILPERARALRRSLGLKPDGDD
jgi:hypothetical protein